MLRAFLRPRNVFLAVAILVALAGLAIHQHGSSPFGSMTPNVPAAVPSLQGRLLYTRDGGLWSLTLADGVATQLVAAPELGQVTAARWSPDGKLIVYAVHEIVNRRTPVSHVYVADADGGNARSLAESSDSSTFYQLPAWAADGQHIYVVHTAQNVRRIERIDLQTGDPQPLIEELGQFDLSRDGRWLALAKSGPTGISLVLLDLATGQQRELVSEHDFDLVGSPRFDPASRRVLFTGAGGRAELDPPVQSFARLLDIPAAAAHGLPQDLFTLAIEGGRPARLASLQVDDPSASWSPDATSIAILSYEALQTVAVNDGRATPVLVPGGFGSVDWAL